MTEEAQKEALRELDRLSKMPPAAAEYTVARTYLDWLIALPWTKETTDNLDIARARTVLDEDHWGLRKVKDRILEYLAVKSMRALTRTEVPLNRSLWHPRAAITRARMLAEDSLVPGETSCE